MNKSLQLQEMKDLSDQVQSFVKVKDYFEAITTQEQLLQLSCEVYGLESIETLSIMASLASLFIKRSTAQVEDAEDLYLRVINHIRSHFELNSAMNTPLVIMKWKLLYANSIVGLGRVIELDNTRVAEAEYLYHDALKMYRQLYPDDIHFHIGDILLSLASLHANTHDYQLSKLRCEQAYYVFDQLQLTHLLQATMETYHNIIKKHILYLEDNRMIEQIEVVKDQILSPMDLRGCSITEGRVILSYNDLKNQQVYIALYPNFLSLENHHRCNTNISHESIHVSWVCINKSVNTSQTILKGISSLFQGTLIGKLLPITQSLDSKILYSIDISQIRIIIANDDNDVIQSIESIQDMTFGLMIVFNDIEVKSLNNIQLFFKSNDQRQDWIDTLQPFINNTMI